MWLRFIKNRPAASGTIKCPLHPLPHVSFIFILFCIYYNVTIAHLQTICISATIPKSGLVEKREKSLIWAIHFGPSFLLNNTHSDSYSPNELQTWEWTVATLLGWCWLICCHFVSKIPVHSSLVRSVQPSIIVHSTRKRKMETLHRTAQHHPGIEPRSLVTARFHQSVRALICRSWTQISTCHTSSISVLIYFYSVKTGLKKFIIWAFFF